MPAPATKRPAMCTNDFRTNITGKTVKAFISADVGHESECFPAIEFTDGSILVIGRDAEGNGPGFADLVKGGKDLGQAGAGR